MTNYTFGGGIDWAVVVGPVGTLLGVALGWWLHERRERGRELDRVRAALAITYLDFTEAAFLVDQLVNHRQASPQRGEVTLEFPSFRQDAGLLSVALGDEEMAQVARTIYGAKDATAIYRRVAQATVNAPPSQNDVDSLITWLADVRTAAAALHNAPSRPPR